MTIITSPRFSSFRSKSQISLDYLDTTTFRAPYHITIKGAMMDETRRSV
jgi:hypothetical protein